MSVDNVLYSIVDGLIIFQISLVFLLLFTWVDVAADPQYLSCYAEKLHLLALKTSTDT